MRRAIPTLRLLTILMTVVLAPLFAISCSPAPKNECQILVNDDLCVLRSASVNLTSQRMDEFQIIDIDLLWSDESVRYVPGKQGTLGCIVSDGKFVVHMDKGVLTARLSSMSEENIDYGFAGLRTTKGQPVFEDCKQP
ncbi:hypothetical protein [Hyphomonas adhaerens]|nr:hypothetical protein [Hyphomonas adhaerens]MBB39331.1 hypothetical protein [Hyphomonas sp.]